ncbi:F0F1 ATP synthase subunit delta [Marinisporobacter balticus]|uniref:ATP synthase subunit delta n=1 Tax=Marinisporobacter balticus TaxID=2018667 RepID=A0A4R2L4A7_9FIRM|nr:F0F1 ATP synthase subunit delta [Marinisporobacter balticus]TCO78799.1 ATP synthase F1 subcomplex delta subunit [Marinisporobacter balticus]
MVELVSKTYASALFEVANENNQLDQLREELTFVLEMFEKHPEFYRFYITPQISKEEKKQVLQELFKSHLSIEVLNFLKIILDKRRTHDLKRIVNKYVQFVNDHNNIVEGIITTVIPLENKNKEHLENKLSNMTGKKIQLKNEIDPSIIGGILVRIGDKVIDGTIQSRLNELQKDLAQIIV